MSPTTSGSRLEPQQPEQPLATRPVLDLTLRPLYTKPFGHVVVEEFIRPDVYQELLASFPSTLPTEETANSLTCYWGSETYEHLIEHNWAWKALFEATHSQAFIDYALAQFQSVYRTKGCLLELKNTSYVHHQESDEEKKQAFPVIDLSPEQLWVRMDIRQGEVGYHRLRHVDWRRRLVSMLIYLCDKDENQMEGGDLVLHPPFLPKFNPFTKTVEPRHNRMAAFACPANSIHSVPLIKRQTAPRKFIQILVSSSIQAWRT